MDDPKETTPLASGFSAGTEDNSHLPEISPILIDSREMSSTDSQTTVLEQRNDEIPKPAQALAALDQLLAQQIEIPEDVGQMREKTAVPANPNLLGYQTSPVANRSHLSTIFSESEDHELEKDDDLGELSEIKSIAEPLDFKKASFSSIASTQGRQEFVTALDNIHQALAEAHSDRQKTPVATDPSPSTGQQLKFKSTHIVLADPKVFKKMDSPSDISPNASPRHGQNMPIPDFSPRDHSNPDSIDSTGFEKVERPSDDVLEQYSQNFAQQMQQSIFGQLPDDPDFHPDEDGFEVITMRQGGGQSRMDGQTIEGPPGRQEDEVHVLERIPGDIDEADSQAMQRPHDDILEKSYGNDDHHGHHDDLIDIPHNHPEPQNDFLGDYQDHPPRHPTPPKDDFADLLAPHGEIDHHPIQQNHQQPSPPAVPAHHEDPFSVPHNIDRHDEDIHDHVEDVHDDVDALMERMRENVEQPEAHPASPSGDSGRDTVGKLLGEDSGPDFGRQTPEEQMMERHGPLTIPELPESLPTHEEEDELDAFVRPPSHGHHGFETEPRPPTPPKDLSDEDIKPSVVNLGPAPHHHHHTSKQHSILKHGPWIDFKTVDPRILDLIYWRDPKKSGAALGLTLLALFVLAKYPILSVVTYTSLLVLAGTLGFRIFKAVEAQIKKTEQRNPFQSLLDTDLALPQDKVHEQVDVLVEHGQVLANQTRRLFLVESIVDSVKFGLLLWALTYVAQWFSGFGLLIIFVLGIFSIPKFYEVYQEPIDQHLGVVKGHIDNVTNIVEEKLPFLKRARVEAEKKDQ